MTILSCNTNETESRPEDQIISIIGGGATSVAFLHNYLKVAESANDLPRRLHIFEARKQFGPGAAYEPDLVSNLLNTKAGFITPFHDRPADFFKWLTVNQADWEARYPSLNLDENSYAPRCLFGEYLESQMRRLVAEASDLGITIYQVSAEVTDVAPVENGYVVSSDCHSVRSDFVFFLCGGQSQALQPDGQSSKRMLASPYPLSDLTRTIPKTASVGIVGARLSCIDTVIGLFEKGHQGPVSIHSCSGYFPTVRGTQARITPKVLTLEGLAKLTRAKGKLRLKDLIGLVCEEIRLQGGSGAAGKFSLPLPPTDLIAFLQDEIEKAGQDRIWQAVLYSTNGIIDRLWASLHEDDQAEFIELYFSIFMAYRVSIPAENAKKIVSYLASGRLSFISGGFVIDFAPDGSPTVKMQGGDRDLKYDYLVNATGSTRVVSSSHSRLVCNLLRRGLMSPHRLGGISVDSDSYSLIGSDGKINPQLRAVGELTVGTFFFTSALDINARHARSCAQQFAVWLNESKLALAA